ncbi:hypothetical protein C9374_000554 [Naegleria lovaniensis]|uniref:ABC3 transporter permease C-terminal domain-containing protein n=1 Tax=Naegleria lovaniensis TaxID=51637 RepID=A0AA88KLY5_NAELO|nr:uncharacterized protein C9374_000554 [Naegleria lovaniensis]KAG2388390.1 hypothetical protein C9374_000554 [Naegleria lovaniensis]
MTSTNSQNFLGVVGSGGGVDEEANEHHTTTSQQQQQQDNDSTTATTSSSSSSPIIYSNNPYATTPHNNSNNNEAFIELEEYSSRPSNQQQAYNDHEIPDKTTTTSQDSISFTPTPLKDAQCSTILLVDESSQFMNTTTTTTKTSSSRSSKNTTSNTSSSSASSSHHDHHSIVTLTKEEYELLKQLQQENEELRKIINSNVVKERINTELVKNSSPLVVAPQTLKTTIDPNTTSHTTLTYRSHVKNATNHDDEQDHMAKKYLNIPSVLSQPQSDTKQEEKKKHHKTSFKFPNIQEFKKFIISLIFLYWTYLSHNLREIRKRKLAYLLGVGSCVVVVFVVCVSLTVLQQVPIIFLRLAENNKYEADMVITPSNAISSTTAFNLTAMKDNIIRATGQKDYESKYSYHSPRIELTSQNIYSSSSCKTENNGVSLPSFIDSFDDMDKISWFYNGINSSSSSSCRRSSSFCVPKYCTQVVKSNLYILDLERERRMEFGRAFEYPLLQKNEAYVSSSMASNLNLKVGDTFIIQMNTKEVLNGPFRQADLIYDPSNSTLVDKVLKFTTYFSFRVKDIIPHNFRKMEYTVRDFIFIEYKYLLHSIAPYLNPNQYSKTSLMNLLRVNMDEYAKVVYWNLAPSRIQKYNLQQYTDVRSLVVNFASSLSYYIGFDQVSQTYPVLQFLNSLRFVSMFLSLIINVIITILTLLSTVLIYSLLMINVENRTFEMGVLRMIGMHRKGLIQLIIIQAFLYSIPGLLLGLISGGASYVGVSYLLGYFFDASLSKLLDPTSVGVAIALGLVIPILASLLPIKSALGQNLHDSLDTERSKTKSIEYSIERNSETSFSPTLVAVPLLAIVAGFCVYYFFPSALLTLNLNILLSMFFAVLLGMLLGLVVLALNLENILEAILTHLLLFWEHVALKQLILKNLVAHRVRNRKTTIMYAMSLGFVIFVSIAFNLQLSNFKYISIQDYGTRLIVTDNNSLEISSYLAQLEWYLMNYHRQVVKDVSFMSYPLTYYTAYSKNEISTMGGYKTYTQTIRCVPPNFFNIANPYFLITDQTSRENSYSLSEQLYTISGSQRILIGTAYKQLLSLKNLENMLVVKYTTPTDRFPIYNYTLMKPMAFVNSAPVFLFSAFPSSTSQPAVVSCTTYMRMANQTFNSLMDVPIERLFIDVYSNATENQVKAFKSDFSSYIRLLSISLKDVNDEMETINVALDATNFLLLFVTVLSMIMCFFSLVSSLYTNIQEQTKEIAILRAIGCKKFFVTRLYVYEALILVLAASLIGIVIGFIIGFTMMIQSNLFTELPISVYVPWQLILIVVGLAFLSAFLSAFFPVVSLLRNGIVTLLKRMVT